MLIACRDCDTDWCDRHRPVQAEMKCPGVGHDLTPLAESFGWCGGEGFVYRIWTDRPHPDLEHHAESGTYTKWFDTHQALISWFQTNVVEVTA